MFSTRDRKSDSELAPPPSNPQNLRRFLAFARPYRWLILVIVGAGVTRYALQFVTPWGVGFLLDGALKNVDRLAAYLRGPRLMQVHRIAAILIGALIARCGAQ